MSSSIQSPVNTTVDPWSAESANPADRRPSGLALGPDRGDPPQHPAPWRVVLLLPQLATRRFSFRGLLGVRHREADDNPSNAVRDIAGLSLPLQPLVQRLRQHPYHTAVAVVLLTLLLAAAVLWQGRVPASTTAGRSAAWNPPASWPAHAATQPGDVAHHDAEHSHGNHAHHRLASQPHDHGSASHAHHAHDDTHTAVSKDSSSNHTRPTFRARSNTPATTAATQSPQSTDDRFGASAVRAGSLAPQAPITAPRSTSSPSGSGRDAQLDGSENAAPLLIQPTPTTTTNRPAASSGPTATSTSDTSDTTYAPAAPTYPASRPAAQQFPQTSSGSRLPGDIARETDLGPRYSGAFHHPTGPSGHGHTHDRHGPHTIAHEQPAHSAHAPRRDTLPPQPGAASNQGARVPSAIASPRIAQRPRRPFRSPATTPAGRSASHLTGKSGRVGSSSTYRMRGVAEMQGTITPANPTDDRP